MLKNRSNNEENRPETVPPFAELDRHNSTQRASTARRGLNAPLSQMASMLGREPCSARPGAA